MPKWILRFKNRTHAVKTNVRLIAATSADLEKAIAARTFREDLHYRLNVFTIYLPPLRERRTDILLLADSFLEKYAIEHAKSIRRISTGRRFGRWVVRGRATRIGRHTRWLCECDCGTLRAVRTEHLLDGKSRSCRCVRYRNAPPPSELSPSTSRAGVDRAWLARRIARGEDATTALRTITPQLRKRH